MTTVADLIDETANHLYGGYRPTINFIDGSPGAAATTITLELDPDGIAPGSTIAVTDELMLVKSVDRSTKTVTVVRGFRDSDAAAYTDGTLVEVNPRFPRYRIKNYLRTEIRSWPASVYRTTSVDLDTVSGTSGYDLTGVSSDFYAILDVQIGPHSSSDRVDWTRVGYHLIRPADTAIFPSGAGIVLTGVNPTSARDFRVTVSRPFDVTTAWTDATVLETDCGLPASMVDIPPLGAAARLMVGRDVARSFGEGQGEPRRAEEIPPGFAGSIATFLRRETQRRLSEEAGKLSEKFPPRF